MASNVGQYTSTTLSTNIGLFGIVKVLRARRGIPTKAYEIVLAKNPATLSSVFGFAQTGLIPFDFAQDKKLHLTGITDNVPAVFT